jgi:hypothetical protein
MGELIQYTESPNINISGIVCILLQELSQHSFPVLIGCFINIKPLKF